MARIVVLTGAGISKESGIPTFRDLGGYWQQHRVEEVASPEGFAANPALVHDFYNTRRRHLQTPEIAPNDGHRALAEFAARTADDFLLVTQNVDDLHERAGSRDVVHMHGELLKARCAHCESVREWREDLSTALPCPACQRRGGLRPHIVWFGEMPLEMERIHAALSRCELFVAIGTSGQVYPAAGFTEVARDSGAETVEINPVPSGGRFDRVIEGPASSAVREFFRALK
ncbi:MAG: NAD-dependent deacylase [Verrucomicrobia bacterium]|nr:NAD-dependent deacylase [Verrucomicrobiota bacterium]